MVRYCDIVAYKYFCGVEHYVTRRFLNTFLFLFITAVKLILLNRAVHLLKLLWQYLYENDGRKDENNS